MREFVVYILSNSAATLYIGVTSDIEMRMWQHGERLDPKSFVSRYALDRLVFMETYPDARQAIAREKQLWSRAKKLKLIREQNPDFKNMLVENFASFPGADPSTSSG